MTSLTLLRRNDPLASPAEQRRLLEDEGSLPRFGELLTRHGLPPLKADGIEVLQVNLGKLCNQTCAHCHVDAGPDRRETMSRETAEHVVRALHNASIPTLDITGGAPEMNPNFRWIVGEARSLGCTVIDRCNLTILETPGFADLAGFLAENQVEVVASLPCYLEENCDRQRGDGVFQKSIAALRRLNRVGYGASNATLPLTLVYNPIGPMLPPPQERLEDDYRRELRDRYEIEFTRLIAITNLPISRFLDDLLTTGNYEKYMQTLVAAFNPTVTNHVMCRTMVSVDWQGRLYDCDFNQMLDLPVNSDRPTTIGEFNQLALANRNIATGRHCFGCTAGCGSSCFGSIADG